MIDNNIIEKAKELRATVERLAQKLNDKDALENIELFPSWNGSSKEYKEGEKVKYQGKLYRTLVTHISQNDWTPADAPSLFTQVLVSKDGESLPWVQPTSTNPYSIGDKVIFDDKIYESIIDNNMWNPVDYPLGWKEITE